MTYTVQKTDQQWREELSPQEYRVLREAGTERPFSSPYETDETVGVYRCRGCGSELFRSEHKFDAHCGWPAFYTPLAEDRVELIDRHARSACGASRCAARTAVRTSGTCSRARATAPRPISGTASTASR